MNFTCQHTCVVFFISLAAHAIWIWRSSKATNGIIFFSTMQFRTQSISSLPNLTPTEKILTTYLFQTREPVTQIVFWGTLLMCVSGHCNPIRKVVSLSDIFSFCFFSCSLRIMICLHSKLLVEMACLQHFMVSTHAWLKKFHKTSCSDVLYVETNTHKRVASLP